MKRKILACVLACSLLLSGCASFSKGSYVFTQDHPTQPGTAANQPATAQNYRQLYALLEEMAQNGVESGVILVQDYRQNAVLSDAQRAIAAIMRTNPVAAYAVESADFDLGTNGGELALAVNIQFLHDRTEIRQIEKVSDPDEAKERIAAALNACDVRLVMQIEQFTPTDFVLMVEDYAMESPENVIEQPQVTVSIYPDSGTSRIVELKFSYQTNRDTLREMQQSVKSMFTSAKIYVSGAENAPEKYALLSSFLMKRFDYTLETSITPAYSLLMHGVGDARAFALVYAAMCRQSGLDCQVISGTRAGTPWYWNVVCYEGEYYHIDLLRIQASGSFQLLRDVDMGGYVWDYSAYPAPD